METPWHHLGTSKTTLRQHLEKLGDHMAPFENCMDKTWAPIGNYMKATWRRLLDNLGLRWEKFDATLVKLLTTLGPHRDYWRNAPLPCGQHMATFSVISKKWNKRLEFWRKERRETAKGWAQTQKGNIQLPPKWGNQWKFTYNDIYNLFSISSCHCPLRILHLRVLAPNQSRSLGAFVTRDFLWCSQRGWLDVFFCGGNPQNDPGGSGATSTKFPNTVIWTM